MQPSKEQIENAARLVPERMAPEFGEGMAWNEYQDDARPWQPWADTEAGRSDALVLLAAVEKYAAAQTYYDGYGSDWYGPLHDAMEAGNVEKIQAATFAAAIAIGQHMEQSNEN